MLHSVQDIARNKWRGILSAIGIDSEFLTGRHTACPVCGGKDRFRFDDKDGRGSFYCSGCGAGDGVELVKRFRGIGFKEAALEVEKAAGFVRHEAQKAGKTDVQKLDALKRTWKESRQVIASDDAGKYLASRGLEIPSGLRIHPALAYRDGEIYLGKFPTMLAKMQSPDGHGVTIHRTYLHDGKKAPVPTVKKLMPGLPMKGAAIRLYEHGEVLGVAEGIETSIAAHMIHKVPVWSCYSANGVESFIPPAGVNRVIVFADCDESFTGQSAAYALAKRLKAHGIVCDVHIPSHGDWADQL